MGDIIDNAQELNELHERVSFHNHALKKPEPTPTEFDGVHCTECSDPVEPQRLSHSYFRCAECQKLHEKDQKIRAISGRR